MLNEVFRTAPNFANRLSLQKEFEEKAKKGKEQPYVNYFGEYTRALEKTITLLLGKLLETKKEPVIAMDVGGGIGRSWLDIASSFSREIHEGRLVFAVSNLKTEPEKLIAEQRLSPERRNQEIENLKMQRSARIAIDNKLTLSLRKISKKRVQYVTGSASELPYKTIALPNGREIPLLGNVDILHENLSITAWSLTPEADVISLSELMSRYSTYFVPEADIHIHQRAHLYSSFKEVGYIKDGINLAHEALQRKLGLIKFTMKLDEWSMPYTVFRKPDSPASKRQLKTLASQ